MRRALAKRHRLTLVCVCVCAVAHGGTDEVDE